MWHSGNRKKRSFLSCKRYLRDMLAEEGGLGISHMFCQICTLIYPEKEAG